MPNPPTSARTQVRRLPERGNYDREVAYPILDEAFICHVGFHTEEGTFVIPTGFGRDGDSLLVHGSAASRMLRALSKGVQACVTVTLLDALVLARSAFNHSVNYRSVVVMGSFAEVTDTEEKVCALQTISEQIIKGRWKDVRGPNQKELKATTVLRMPIEEFSVKQRSGGAKDDAEDYALPVWAGLLPIHTSYGPAETDEKSHAEVPANVARYRRSNSICRD
jgi:nitroimidazol reductase NimA-like FMN-containing flavoprotein (pyridoxamine 5'-phosphate oxidase superfamily)